MVDNNDDVNKVNEEEEKQDDTSNVEDVVDPYKSSSFIGFSLWMCPSNGSVADVIYTRLIEKMSNEYDTFCYVPHITLVAGMLTSREDVIDRTKILASKLKPYQYELMDDKSDNGGSDDRIGYRDAYFQCIYAKLKCTQQVLEANSVARSIFQERQNDPPYMPHLSLVYGDFTEEEKVTDMIPNIKRKLEDLVVETSTSLKDKTDDNENKANEKEENHKSFTIDTIEIWSTQGDVADWYLVERIPLKG